MKFAVDELLLIIKKKPAAKRRKKLVFAARLSLEALTQLSGSPENLEFFEEAGNGYEALVALRKVLKKEA
jgi:hypothetical protein